MGRFGFLVKLVSCIGIAIVSCPADAQNRGQFIESRFDSFDKDGDGRITASEANRPFLIRQFDKDGDGALSIDEFRAVMEKAVNRQGPSTDAGKPWQAADFVGDIPDAAPISQQSVLAAAQYSASKKGISFLVMYDGKPIYADYPNGGSATRGHELASGTKSFTGVMAIAAIEDGLIASLDENVSDTITEWKDDPLKSKITVRQLLDLTSGISPGSSDGGQVPSYASAIRNPTLTPPGEKFNYGPAHFQCFGELMRRKLKSGGSSESPLEYLTRRIFKPIGLDYARWRSDEDGHPHLPSGAALTATEWAKFGELIRLGGTWEGTSIIPQSKLDQCFVGNDANPAYGLTFWLNTKVKPATRRSIPQIRFGSDDLTNTTKIPSDIVFAAGAGKQRLFISRDAKLVVVRQADGIVDALDGKRDSYSDLEFLSRLLK
ncbi:Beta-lactamase [Rubripirellula tenax]|uniref:Beta-lactamase n=1 Tax=Rubripirellula tenax TaxID=2528015 RepID=A0A5C6F6V1_9BACT|nr:serine hydrolase [Rubripirellula tenax]TWU56985.1 Beta-lactamase [Rubripirellula tenax]